jgi:hypothetical protein
MNGGANGFVLSVAAVMAQPKKNVGNVINLEKIWYESRRFFER